MYGLFTGIILFICVLLVLIVLVQNPKGGGLVSSFSSSNQFMGVKRTADFVEKTTWGLATALFILSVLATCCQRRVQSRTGRGYRIGSKIQRLTLKGCPPILPLLKDNLPNSNNSSNSHSSRFRPLRLIVPGKKAFPSSVSMSYLLTLFLFPLKYCQ